MEARKDFTYNEEFVTTFGLFDHDRWALVLDHVAETKFVQLEDKSWDTPLNGEHIEALDKHPHLASLVEEFPESIRGEMREFFAKGLRAGGIYPSKRSPNADLQDVTGLLPIRDRITGN